jgi:hypothetical protein
MRWPTRPCGTRAKGVAPTCEPPRDPEILGLLPPPDSRGPAVGRRLLRMLRQDSRHPSLHLKKVGRLWSVRVGLHYRALAVEDGSDLVWFWIGTHTEYDRVLGHA